VRLEAGWVSEKAGDGTVLLERLEEEETDEEEDDTDTETEVTATDTDGGSSAPARKPRAKAKKAASRVKYRVKQRAVVRSGFEMTSAPAAGKPLKIGDVIEALETKVNAKGVTRVHLEAGWVSEKAGDGTVLLERLEEEETDEEETDDGEFSDLDNVADDSEGHSSSEDSVVTESEDDIVFFKVLQRAVLRSGFAMTSKPAGCKPLKIGQTIQALEMKVNDKGVTRVQCPQGWLSEKAADGTVLLEEYTETKKEKQVRLDKQRVDKHKRKRARHKERATRLKKEQAAAAKKAKEEAENAARIEAARVAAEEEAARAAAVAAEERRMKEEAERKAAEAKAIVEAQLLRAEIAKQLELQKHDRREIERMILDERARVDMLTAQLEGEKFARQQAQQRMEDAAKARASVLALEAEARAQAEAERREAEAAAAAEQALWEERFAVFNEAGSGSLSKIELVNMMAVLGCRGLAEPAKVDRVFETFRTKRHVAVTEAVVQDSFEFVIDICQPEVDARQRAGWEAAAEDARWSLKITPGMSSAHQAEGFVTELAEGVELDNFKRLYTYLQQIADREMLALVAEEDAERLAEMEMLEREQAAAAEEAATARAYERREAAEVCSPASLHAPACLWSVWPVCARVRMPRDR
jgi:hypothetical protein